MADDSEFNNEVEEYNRTLQDSMQLSLKDHLDKLEDAVRNILGELEVSKKEIVIVRSDFDEFNSTYNNNNKNFNGMIEKRMNLLNKDFDRLIKESKSDLMFLRTQLEKTLEESDMLEELTDELEKQIFKNEDFIGFGHFIDDEPIPNDEEVVANQYLDNTSKTP